MESRWDGGKYVSQSVEDIVAGFSKCKYYDHKSPDETFADRTTSPSIFERYTESDTEIGLQLFNGDADA